MNRTSILDIIYDMKDNERLSIKTEHGYYYGISTPITKQMWKAIFAANCRYNIKNSKLGKKYTNKELLNICKYWYGDKNPHRIRGVK